MTLSALGIFSAAGAGGVRGDYELIESVILGTATTSVSFSSLGTFSSTYKHLQIRYTARTDASFNAESMLMRLNSDTGTNYVSHDLNGGSGTVISSAYTGLTYARAIGLATANSASANNFGAGVTDILDAYSTSKNKTVRSLSGELAAGEENIRLGSSAWLSTSSITTILIDSINGTNLVAGSRFSLYGIRG
jgi:hypothetical protein